MTTQCYCVNENKSWGAHNDIHGWKHWCCGISYLNTIKAYVVWENAYL